MLFSFNVVSFAEPPERMNIELYSNVVMLSVSPSEMRIMINKPFYLDPDRAAIECGAASDIMFDKIKTYNIALFYKKTSQKAIIFRVPAHTQLLLLVRKRIMI